MQPSFYACKNFTSCLGYVELLWQVNVAGSYNGTRSLPIFEFFWKLHVLESGGYSWVSASNEKQVSLLLMVPRKALKYYSWRKRSGEQERGRRGGEGEREREEEKKKEGKR